MGKQTMGTPGTALKYRTDNKSYRLQTGQTPVVRTPKHNEYGLDNFPNGTNAVVAVISYTGYDMDDAMILNKSAHERGFGYGTIYKAKKVDLNEDKGRRGAQVSSVFGFAPGGLIKAQWRATLDDDGLPAVGTKVREGDAIAAHYSVTKDPHTGEYENKDGVTHIHRYKDAEEAYVEEVKIIGNELGNGEPFQVSRPPCSATASMMFTKLIYPIHRPSASVFAFLAPLSLATNFPLAMAKKVSCLKNGPRPTCPSPNPACNPT